MSSHSVSRAVDRALRISILDGVLFALMLGASENYFGACAVALGHGNTALAMLSTLPLFAGALAQAFTAPLVVWLGSRKRLVVLGAALQAVSHLGLLAISALSVHALWPLLALVLVYYVAGMVIAPAWGAWMGALTERVDRERYFALRSTCVSVVALAAFVWAGHRLQASAVTHDLARAYAWLFGAGFAARAASSVALAHQPDPLPVKRDSLLRVLARTRAAVRGEGFRFAVILGVWLFGAQVSIPFYTPYMLKTLRLGYDGFALVCAVQLVTKSIAFPFTHRAAARFGLPRVLMCAMGTAALVAFMWGTQRNLTMILIVQAVSGVAWACYEFASFQLLLQSARPRERVEFLAMSASFSGLMQLAGALLGSFLLARVGLHYREVFLVSALLRGLPLLLFVPYFYERRAELVRALLWLRQ